LNTQEQFTGTVQDEVTLHGRFSLYERVYFKTFDLSLASTGLRPDGWLWRYLRQLGKNTELTPMHSSSGRALKVALEEAYRVKSWKTLDLTQEDQATKSVVWQAFTGLEEALLNHPSGANTAASMSAEIRKFTLSAVELNHPGIAQLVRASFKSRLSYNKAPRPLISQLPGLDENNVPRHPLDALAHETLADLKRKQRNLLESDLAKVERACETEMLAHDSFVRRLEEALCVPVTDLEIELIGDSTLWTKTERSNGWFDSVAPNPLHLGSIFLRLIKRQSPDSRPVVRFRLGRVRLIRARLIELGVVDRESADNPFRTYLFGDAHMRVACALALQAHTGWNCSSVMSLTTNRVVGSKPPYTVQGYKSKTGSDVPACIIEASDSPTCQAIEFLLRRLADLKRLNIVPVEETQLWINPSNVVTLSGRASTYVSHPSDLKSFQAKHGLPLFSPDGVRAQVLAIRSDLGSRPEEARQTAGHTVLDTTAGYLQQEILKSIGTAINLQFQRKLEDSTSYEDSLNGQEDDRDIAASLFYPIGDGSSCRDAKKPPNVSYLRDGVCDGQNCHAGDGCDNRLIVLNKARVLENWKQIQFYKRNWKDLLAGYPDRFKRLHLPSMTFAMTLGAIISNGPLGGYQKTLAKDGEASK